MHVNLIPLNPTPGGRWDASPSHQNVTGSPARAIRSQNCLPANPRFPLGEASQPEVTGLLEVLGPVCLPGAAGDAEMVDRVWGRLWLSEGEHVRLGARLEEHDLQRPLADRVMLAHEMVQAAVPEQAVAVLVDVHTM